MITSVKPSRLSRIRKIAPSSPFYAEHRGAELLVDIDHERGPLDDHWARDAGGRRRL
jgi:hypothetical protein